MFVQLVSIKVKPGHVDEFLEAFRINYLGTIAEPGNIRFDVLQDPEDPTKFTIYEVFRSGAAVDDHRRTDHYKECVRRIEPITEGPRAKQYYRMLMSDTLDAVA